MNAIESSCIKMLRTYPDLFASRADCLMHLFSHPGTRWDTNGQLSFIDENTELERSTPVLADEDAAIAALRHDHNNSFHRRYCEVDLRLQVRRNNAAANFVLINAELLAVERNSRLSRAPNPVFARFDDMPEHAAQEWVSAAHDLAIIVCDYVMGEPYVWQNQEAQAQVQDQIKAAQTRCAAFLMRSKTGGLDQTRAARLDALRQEAEALGYTIVARDAAGAPPITQDNKAA